MCQSRQLSDYLLIELFLTTFIYLGVYVYGHMCYGTYVLWHTCVMAPMWRAVVKWPKPELCFRQMGPGEWRRLSPVSLPDSVVWTHPWFAM